MDMILAVMVYGYGIFLLLLLLLPPPISAQAGNSNGSGSNSSDSSSDGRALMGFKWSSGGSSRGLVSWKKKDPCSGRWIGVRCEEGRVIYLVLRGLNLVGGIDSLTSLDKLQVLILSNNSLNATLPLDMSGWSSSLKLLNLSNNQFSGPVPPPISNLTRLTRLDVSGNRLSGEIPPLASLSRLLALRLQNNQLSGRLASLPSALADLNVSGNELEGAIPASLAKFPVTAFAQNPKLCGPPLSLFCNPLINTTTTTASSPSSPSSMPTPTSSHAQTKSSKQLSVGTIIAIVLGDFAVLLIISIFFALYFWHKYSHPSPPPCSNSNSNSNSNSSSKISKKKKKEQPKIVFSGSGHYSSFLAAETEKGKLVFVVEGLKKRFELEDLLRASAEMLGKGSFGTTYKAVLDDGSAVAVKRLKDSITSQGRREFEQQMEVISRLRHPHLLTLRAYYYSKDEKLLVYEYLPNGNLHSLLHENRGPGRTPLDWTTRIKIALGAARGIAYIHHECKSQRMPHGDIKSSNVLVDKEGNACVSDFGLIMLASPSNAATATILPGYKAPEQAEGKKASQRGDTYSFGVLLLELLTGKSPTPPDRGDGFEVIDLPRWVQSVVREEWTSEVFDLELLRYKNIEEEMVSMLQIAMSCVSESPRLRPRMSQVVKMIYDIIGGAGGDDHSSPHCESFDSTSLSSSLSEGTSH